MAKNELPVSERVKVEELEELRYIQQVYQNQLGVISNSINIGLQELREMGAAQKTIEEIDRIKDRSVLTNIGGDFYLNSKIWDEKTVIVGVGARYLIEKDLDSAKAFVSALVNKKTALLDKMIKKREELDAALIDVTYRIDSLIH
jgi:prefoldin alpha subunit